MDIARPIRKRALISNSCMLSLETTSLQRTIRTRSSNVMLKTIIRSFRGIWSIKTGISLSKIRMRIIMKAITSFRSWTISKLLLRLLKLTCHLWDTMVLRQAAAVVMIKTRDVLMGTQVHRLWCRIQQRPVNSKPIQLQRHHGIFHKWLNKRLRFTHCQTFWILWRIRIKMCHLSNLVTISRISKCNSSHRTKVNLQISVHFSINFKVMTELILKKTLTNLCLEREWIKKDNSYQIITWFKILTDRQISKTKAANKFQLLWFKQ